ncbi:MAG: hypothetical protein F4119_06470, partial [Acidimicrobiia bacterium]|nr:hypothetical protein [Acidimicrobiia bacterium]
MEQATIALLGSIITLILYLDRGHRRSIQQLRTETQDNIQQLRTETQQNNQQLIKQRQEINKEELTENQYNIKQLR